MSNLVSKTLCSLSLAALCASPLQADTLAEVYKIALENDSQLKAAHAAYKIGQQSIPLARSGILPKIVATATFSDGSGDSSASRTLNTDAGAIVVGQSGENDDKNENYSISLMQPLFDLPAWFAFKQGYDLDKKAQAEFAAAQQDLIINVTSSYIGVLRASETLITAKAEQRAVGRQLEQTKERFEVGLLPITDVHEAQANFDSRRVDTLEAEGALDIAFEALEVMTGQTHTSLAGLAEEFPIEATNPPDRAAWVAFAQSNNFALKAAQLGRDAAEKNAKAKRAEHLPKVTATLSYADMHQTGSIKLDGGGSSQPFTNDSTPLSFSIQVNAPLYTGGYVSAARKIALQELIQARESLLHAQRSITQQARSEHLQVKTNSARVEARKLGITSAQSALEATQAGYDVGTRNIVDLLLSQRLLYSSQRDYANARYDYILSMFKLKGVAGLLSPEDLNTLNTWLKSDIVIGRSDATKL